MVAKKRASKRVTLQKKYKVERRTKDHHQKLKKGTKKMVGSMRKKLVENFVPNSWPYKEDVLKEIQLAKDKLEEAKQRQRDKRTDEMNKRRGIKTGDSMAVSSSSSASSAPKLHTLGTNFDTSLSSDMPDSSEFADMDEHSRNFGQSSRRAYLRELRRTVEAADVVLMVLDARDPLGTRSSAVEEMVLSDHRKKLVYVLNKADLVPREILAGWLTYLRKLHPTVPFKCNTQNQKGNLGSISGKASKAGGSSLQSSQAVGAEELLGLMKNYSRSGDSKGIITVGIVGFPNVGKSSLVNSLTRTRSVGVSPTPGFTRLAQEIILDKNIRLMDSPGIVFADGDSTATALRNCVNVDEMVDVITPVQAILERCPQSYLMQLYSIPRFKNGDAMSFLALIAKSTGKLKKGGIPNIDAAARGIIFDWNFGKIRYYCNPPKLTNSRLESESAIVSSFGASFDIDSMRDEDMKVLDELETYQDQDDGGGFGVDAVHGAGIDFHISEMDSSSSSGGGAASGGGGDMETDRSASSSKKKSAAAVVSRTKKGVESYDFNADFKY